MALVIALISSQERCIATFPIKTNLLEGEEVLMMTDSHKKGGGYTQSEKITR